MALNKSKKTTAVKDQISIEDIYIKLEAIFDIESDYNRRVETYKMLNEMLPKWEGNNQI